MRHLPLVLLAALSGACCLRTAEFQVLPKEGPDLLGVMALTGRFGWASACPVSADTALTAAHVVDPEPFNIDAKMLPFAWEDQDGHSGIVRPKGRYWFQDIALLKPANDDETFPHWYVVATELPKPGDPLWFTGFDYRSEAEAMQPRIWKSQLIRIRSRILVYKPEGDPGTSGGCILNAQGEVVGLVTGWMRTDNYQGAVGLGAVVYREDISVKSEERE